MKKILSIILGVIFLPTVAMAITVPWNKVSPGQIYPPLLGDAVLTGTTTASGGQVVSATTTTWQYSLSQGLGILQWVLRAIGNEFSISTTTVSGISTTSVPALKIAGDGFGTTTIRGLNISGQATSTSNVGFNLNGGCYAVGGNCITSGTSGSGTGNVSTSTNEIAGNLAYWTSNSATPALLGQIATTSVTCSGSTTCTSFTAIGLSPITISSSGSGGSSKWATTTSPDVYGITPAGAGYVDIGTSTHTGIASLTIATSSRPQLSLSAGTGQPQWTLRNVGGKLYLATTTTVGTATTTYPEPFTINSSDGKITKGYVNYYSLSRTIPTTVNDAVDIGSFTFTNGAGIIMLQITNPSSSYSNAKTYMLPVQFAQDPNNTWVEAFPVADTGIYASLRNFALDIRVNNAVTSLRLRNTVGSTAGTVLIEMQQIGVPTDVFTPSAATASVAAPTAYFSSYPIASVSGYVGINYGIPNTKGRLTVSGNNGVSAGALSFVTADAPSADWRLYPSGDQTGTASFRIGASTAANYAWQFDNTGSNAQNFKSVSSLAAQNIMNVLMTPSQTGKSFTVTTSGGKNGDSFVITATSSVGIASSSPWGKFSVSNYSTGADTFPLVTVASSTMTSSTSTNFIISSIGNTGIASTTPWSALSLGSGSSITVGENNLSTSTSMTVDWRGGNTQLIRMGGSATTITFAGFTNGQTLKVITCSPNGTAGAITWGTPVLWAGGTTPTQTTTANKCDVYSFIATGATSTLKIFGAQSANF